jgi:hypothetical protein
LGKKAGFEKDQRIIMYLFFFFILMAALCAYEKVSVISTELLIG